MRLTKRQLKRIIREEYSRLKRRGLIREMHGGMVDYEAEIMSILDNLGGSAAAGDIMNMVQGSVGPDYNYNNVLDALDNLEDMGMVEKTGSSRGGGALYRAI